MCRSGEPSTRERRASSAPDEILQVHLERVGDPPQGEDRDIPAAAFDAAQEGLVDLGAVGELLLGEPAFLPEGLHIEADSHPQIHAGMARKRLTSAHSL